MPNNNGTSTESKVLYIVCLLFATAFMLAMYVPRIFGNAPKSELNDMLRRYDSAQTYWSKRKDSIVVIQKRIDTLIQTQTIRINTLTKERETRIADVRVMNADSLVLVFRAELDSARNK